MVIDDFTFEQYWAACASISVNSAWTRYGWLRTLDKEGRQQVMKKLADVGAWWPDVEEEHDYDAYLAARRFSGADIARDFTEEIWALESSTRRSWIINTLTKRGESLQAANQHWGTW